MLRHTLFICIRRSDRNEELFEGTEKDTLASSAENEDKLDFSFASPLRTNAAERNAGEKDGGGASETLIIRVDSEERRNAR